ncbi:MAG: Mrp/NBP35 family ATP-binding protein [Micavibrio aeruginosavorus]|nr:Mrp/NBP35 family ATP-binding protein [Micavibrio aeruginosavorus]
MLFTISESDVLKALRRVQDPARGQDIVTLGMVSGLHVAKGDVTFLLTVDSAQGVAMEPLRQAAEDAVAKLRGARKVSAILTAEREPANDAPPVAAKKGPAPLREMPAVRQIIAVASGKGGVGKSTVAVNLALGLRRAGLSVGLMDADIYGPSIPRMLNLHEKPVIGENKKLVPLSTYGLKVMSMGLLVDEAAPMIWRGPMVQSAVRQFLEDVEWSNDGAMLDVLVVDMPPGTGDAQLTLAQKVPLSGAVIVSTPQDIALIDARKGLEMFRRTDVPVLGIVENMSYFCCPHCGGRSEIFGHGGARAEADKLGVPFLGEIPLHALIRTLSDAGTPVVAARPDSAEAKPYLAMAQMVADSLKSKAAAA